MKKLGLILMVTTIVCLSCNPNADKEGSLSKEPENFEFVVDRFADIKIMRYRVDNWDQLSLNQKKLVYYLSEAACCGRDIIFDQNCKYNLYVRHYLDEIVLNFNGDTTTLDWKNFMVYTKRFWFSNGMHHHYSNDKFYPEVSKEYFGMLLDSAVFKGDKDSKEIKETRKEILNIIFNPQIAPKRIAQDTKQDLVKNSAVNFYDGVSQQEVEKYYADLKKNDSQANPDRPISYGLNTKVVKEKGKVKEIPYSMNGEYAPAIKEIVGWLQKAVTVAENNAQKNHLNKLIEFYQTGDLKTWDDFNVLWVQDVNSHVDYVNGFIEVYTDPMGMKATWESVVNYKDLESSKRTKLISENAQWFENNSPIDNMFKKKQVKGVEAKAIIVAHLGGECYPATPIGINLPNANWIRKEYGSKSVTMENIMYAYSQAAMKDGVLQEFYFSDVEIKRAEKYGYETDKLQVDLHECLGHGSGQMLAGVDDGMLKNYHSTIEEARADLFSLYYIADPKMVELKLLPDNEAYKACYYKYILNGLMLQLNRVDAGKNITQAHMQNRALIANWCLAHDTGGTFEVDMRGQKTFIRIKDYAKLRQLFATLLTEIQKIKSTGDYDAAKLLVENYAIKPDPTLHKEVKSRYAVLDVAPYGGFINPEFVVDGSGDKISNIKVVYPKSYTQQMLQYDQKYGFLSK